MDFIERLLHVAPDRGNGTSELAIYLVVVAVIVLSLVRARWTRRRRG
jgi:hypothetical protein